MYGMKATLDVETEAMSDEHMFVGTAHVNERTCCFPGAKSQWTNGPDRRLLTLVSRAGVPSLRRYGPVEGPGGAPPRPSPGGCANLPWGCALDTLRWHADLLRSLLTCL